MPSSGRQSGCVTWTDNERPRSSGWRTRNRSNTSSSSSRSSSSTCSSSRNSRSSSNRSSRSSRSSSRHSTEQDHQRRRQHWRRRHRRHQRQSSERRSGCVISTKNDRPRSSGWRRSSPNSRRRRHCCRYQPQVHAHQHQHCVTRLEHRVTRPPSSGKQSGCVSWTKSDRPRSSGWRPRSSSRCCCTDEQPGYRAAMRTGGRRCQSSQDGGVKVPVQSKRVDEDPSPRVSTLWRAQVRTRPLVAHPPV